MSQTNKFLNHFDQLPDNVKKINVAHVTADDVHVSDVEYKNIESEQKNNYQPNHDEIGEDINKKFDEIDFGYSRAKYLSDREYNILTKKIDKDGKRNDDKTKKFGFSKN